MNLSNSDTIAATSAIVALLAFAATIWQGWMTRKHNRLSVRPLLVWHIQKNSTSNGIEITFCVTNKGIGPAIVDDRWFTIEGRKFEPQGLQADLVVELTANILKDVHPYFLQQHGVPGVESSILPQEEVIIAKITFPGLTTQNQAPVIEAIDRAAFNIKYECLYERKFLLSTA